MGFLSGRMTAERFHVDGDSLLPFGTEQLEVLERFAIGQIETASVDEPAVGFLAGGHLFDGDFRMDKNVIDDALYCAVRIDTNQVPAALRKAWLQMELAPLAADNPSGRPTKSQRQQAQEAVDARCQEEAQSGRFRRMQQVPVLWDARESVLYIGSSSSTANEHCISLFSQAFDLDLERMTATHLAHRWAVANERRSEFDRVAPAAFLTQDSRTDVAWHSGQSGNADFLGNEFLLWLWWRWETQSATVPLSDGSDVAGMLARTLTLECPRGESGKDAISAESPAYLPEAAHAIRSGKLPRKAGFTLVRNSEQYEFTLQAETFSIGGAKIHVDGDAVGRGLLEDRIESIRRLGETADLLFEAFCERRLGKAWKKDLQQMRGWLEADASVSKKPAA